MKNNTISCANPDCTEIIEHARLGRKTCSDACRSAVNNARYREENKFKNYLLKKIDYNYSILKEFHLNGKTIISEASLKNRDYHFNIMTEVRIDYKSKREIKCVYDLGLLHNADAAFKLLKLEQDEN